MGGLKVATRDTQTPQHTASVSTEPAAPKSQPPAQTVTPQTSRLALRVRCHCGRLFRRTPGRRLSHSATYAQASAVQARARQPMGALKVAKRDTQAPQHTAETRSARPTPGARSRRVDLQARSASAVSLWATFQTHPWPTTITPGHVCPGQRCTGPGTPTDGRPKSRQT